MVFASGETLKAISIPIPDDHYTEETEYTTVMLKSLLANESTCTIEANTTIVITDNDSK